MKKATHNAAGLLADLLFLVLIAHAIRSQETWAVYSVTGLCWFVFAAGLYILFRIDSKPGIANAVEAAAIIRYPWRWIQGRVFDLIAFAAMAVGGFPISALVFAVGTFFVEILVSDADRASRRAPQSKG